MSLYRLEYLIIEGDVKLKYICEFGSQILHHYVDRKYVKNIPKKWRGYIMSSEFAFSDYYFSFEEIENGVYRSHNILVPKDDTTVYLIGESKEDLMREFKKIKIENL